MLATVVVFDPDSSLPMPLVADIPMPCAVVRADRAQKARLLARHAAVIIVVVAEHAAVTLGFLASVEEPRGARMVVVAMDALRQHHAILRALRRGAIVLIEPPPALLAECVRDLIASMRQPGEVA